MPSTNNPGLLLPSKPVQDSSISPLIFSFLKKTWDSLGKMTNPIQAQTAAFTAGDAYLYVVNCVSGSFTVTLPAALSCKGKEYIFKQVGVTGANAVTIAVASGDNIDSLTSIKLQEQYDTLHIQSDGYTTWNLISSRSAQGIIKPYFDAEKQVNQAITAGSAVKITWPTVNYDTASWWDAVNNRYKPLIKGDYQVQGSLIYTSPTVNASCAIYIYKNGAQYGRSFNGNLMVAANADCSGFFQNIIPMNGSTDYIEIFVFFSNNSSVEGTGGYGNPSSSLEIRLLAQT
jgi:hypothetical protein